MRNISKEELKKMREDFPEGTRVRLVAPLKGETNNSTKLRPGDIGTVASVNSLGDLEMDWDDSKGSLSLIYGVDKYEKVVGEEC